MRLLISGKECKKKLTFCCLHAPLLIAEGWPIQIACSDRQERRVRVKWGRCFCCNKITYTELTLFDPATRAGCRSWQRKLAAEAGGGSWRRKLAAEAGGGCWQQKLVAEASDGSWWQKLAAEAGGGSWRRRLAAENGGGGEGDRDRRGQ